MADDSKTEKATPKKRRDERKKGHVFMSQDAVAVATLFSSVFTLRMTFAGAAERIAVFMRSCLEAAAGISLEISRNMVLQSISLVAHAVGPLFAVVILASVTATMAQTRLLVAPELIRPKLEKISPLKGIKRLFSLRSVIEALKGLLKIIVLLLIIYLSLRNLIDICVRYMYADLHGACTHLFQSIFSMLLRVGLAFLVLAVLDFMYQYWDFERNMRMSKQEIKEEFKQTEGDPQIKSRIKRLQREMAQSRMMQQVPQADVIIRNPTHVAVALRYHVGEDDAPVVLAMGLDALALRIIAVAEENDIMVIENVPLAHQLYAESELDQPIPADLYEAVAEVMVYLYKLGRLQGNAPAYDPDTPYADLID